MNLFRPQKPYVFRPPKYSPILAPLLKKIGAIFFLRRKFKVHSIRVEGAERVAALAKKGRPVLVAPNHGDHADPHVMLSIGSKHGLRFHFMAAREGFEEGRLQGFALQRCGAFSVDREGADVKAIKTAMQILREARFPLVIFPEGQIYHHHERLDCLNEGVATILLRATDKLPDGESAYLVPTGTRYTYDESVADTFSERLSALEERITWKPRNDLAPVERIYRLGSGLLAIKEMEFLGQVQSGGLVDQIANLRNKLVEMIEKKHLGKHASGAIPERVKALRGKIRKQLTSPAANLSDQEEKDLYDDLDTLFVVFQLYSYPGQYLREEPSIHRIAETILKLEEDVLGEAVYASPRQVRVRFAEPIDVRAFLKDRSLNAKTGVGPLTALLGRQIQSMLENLR